MILFFGITNKQEKLNYQGKIKVHSCGKFGKETCYMEYLVFSIFFIPIIKWRKKYYLVYNCCGKIYEIEKEIGKQIEQGENVDIVDENLICVNQQIICQNCNTILDSDYDFCPYCGNKRR